MSAGAAEARHRVANLLHGYTEIADRKDVDAVVNLLGRSRVRFPAGRSDDAESARVFFTGLWNAPVGHRHDVSNLVVEPAQEPGTWRARAHYTRWVLAPSAPVLHTLGEYELLIAEKDWSVRELTVTRTWTAAS